LSFAHYCAVFILASAVCMYYFAKDTTGSPVGTSVCRVVLHLGSIAYGAGLLAIVWMVKAIMEYIYN